MLPFSYAIRNLGRAPGKTFQMVLGALLVVLLIVGASAFNRGIATCLSTTGNPHNIIVLGAGSEESIQRSEISRTAPDVLAASVRKIAKVLGKPAVSPEVYYMGTASLPGGPIHPALFRGITWNAFNVHRGVILSDGHFPNPGEVLVGSLAARHMGLPASALATGQEIVFENLPYKIAGHFDASGTMMDAEIWMDLNDLLTASKRETLSGATVVIDQPEDFDFVELFCKQRLDLELAAVRETDYYASLTRFYKPIRLMVWLTALLVAAGAIFGGINTMYAAFIARRKELATLQAVGYTRTALVFSLFQEALLINLTGGLLAMTITQLFLADIHISFSTGVFHLVFDNSSLILGAITSLLLSIVGIIMPAWGCLKPTLVSSLRSA